MLRKFSGRKINTKEASWYALDDISKSKHLPMSRTNFLRLVKADKPQIKIFYTPRKARFISQPDLHRLLSTPPITFLYNHWHTIGKLHGEVDRACKSVKADWHIYFEKAKPGREISIDECTPNRFLSFRPSFNFFNLLADRFKEALERSAYQDFRNSLDSISQKANIWIEKNFRLPDNDYEYDIEQYYLDVATAFLYHEDPADVSLKQSSETKSKKELNACQDVFGVDNLDPSQIMEQTELWNIIRKALPGKDDLLILELRMLGYSFENILEEYGETLKIKTISGISRRYKSIIKSLQSIKKDLL